MKNLQKVLMVEKNQSMKQCVKRRGKNTYLHFIQVHKNLWMDLQEIGLLRPVYIQGERNQTLSFDERNGKEFVDLFKNTLNFYPARILNHVMYYLFKY